MWGMVRGYFIQYKFIIPETTKHSSYEYQKLFRAIYGYTQTVNKSVGKNYKYQRDGILSNFPYVRTGKNCIIIPQSAFQKLTNFFKTGVNPTHHWKVKGNWKAVYYMDEKEVNSNLVVESILSLIERTKVSNKKNIYEDLVFFNTLEFQDKKALEPVLVKAQKIVSEDWFKISQNNSPKLKEFKELYDKLVKL